MWRQMDRRIHTGLDGIDRGIDIDIHGYRYIHIGIGRERYIDR
jgi:hypothetical protein